MATAKTQTLSMSFMVISGTAIQSATFLSLWIVCRSERWRRCTSKRWIAKKRFASLDITWSRFGSLIGPQPYELWDWCSRVSERANNERWAQNWNALVYIILDSFGTMFSIIQNPIDSRLTIIKDDTNGFYNASHTARQYHEIHTSCSRKKVSHYLSNIQTKELIQSTEQRYQLDYAVIMKRNVKINHRGTYIHPSLHVQFMLWLNNIYISDIEMRT